MKYPQNLPAISYTNDYFSLEVDLKKPDFLATMQLFRDPISTRHIKSTNYILEQRLPSVFLNQCFNEENLSFYDEAKNTEIGHLFEHILLEELFLVEKRLKKDFNSIQGNTSWNWVKDPVGKFYINIKPIDLTETEIINCLENSIDLTSDILSRTNQKYQIN